MLSHEERRKRKRGGRISRGFILHNTTYKHTLTKAYNTGLTLQARTGIHTMAGDYIHINGRKIKVWLLMKYIYIYVNDMKGKKICGIFYQEE